MIKKIIKISSVIFVSVMFGFYIMISLPSFETFFAPVVIKTTFTQERTGEGLLISFEGFKIRPCTTVTTSWSYDDVQNRSTPVTVKNLRTNTSFRPVTLDLGKFTVGPLLFVDLPFDATSLTLVLFHACHPLWNSMTQLEFKL